MEEILGVVQFAPEELDPIDVPPLEAVNHSILPADAVALIETVPVPHLLPPVDPVTVGRAVIVILIADVY